MCSSIYPAACPTDHTAGCHAAFSFLLLFS